MCDYVFFKNLVLLCQSILEFKINSFGVRILINDILAFNIPHLSKSAFPALSSHHPVIAPYDLPSALCTFHLNPQYLYSAGQREYIIAKLESKKIPAPFY